MSLEMLSKQNVLKFFILIVIGIGMFSCVPQSKTLYFQKKKGNVDDLIVHAKPQYKVRPHDVLLITISSLNPQTSEFYNMKAEGGSQGIKGYSISDSGYIYLPVFDSIRVTDMTISEVQNYLQKMIREHVTDATVIVKLSNFNFVVLGEVGNPGMLMFEGNELTIVKAIGLARDITEFGNKKKVILIRKEGNSSRYVTLDLTKRDIMSSEYYYLQPDDIIYVEPLRAKNYRVNVGQISLIIGVASFFLFILNAVK